MSTEDRTYPGADGSTSGSRLAPPPGPNPSPPPPSRLPWLIAILAVLVLAAGVLTAILIRDDGDRAAPQPTPSGTSSASSASSASASGSGSQSAPTGSAGPATTASSQPPATPVVLRRGEEAPGSAIPWAQVTAGWNLRAWNDKPTPDQMPLAPWTIYLVNPVGGRYRIATLAPNTFPALWSPDRRRAVMHSYVGTRDTLREYDLSTGRQLASFVRGNRSLLSYAGPGGHSLLLSRPAIGDPLTSLELVSTGGVHQRTLPATAASGPLPPVLYRTDGSAFLASGPRSFMLVDNDGRTIRQIGFPSGAQSCRASHWWSARTAIGTCSYLTPGNGSGVDNLVLIPVDGPAASAITHSTAPDHSYLDAWHYSGGILATVASGSCGISDLVTLDAAGNSHPYAYRLPTGVSEQVSLLGVHADRASLITGSCGTTSSSLVSLDLRTGATSVLLGPGLNGGSVWY